MIQTIFPLVIACVILPGCGSRLAMVVPPMPEQTVLIYQDKVDAWMDEGPSYPGSMVRMLMRAGEVEVPAVTEGDITTIDGHIWVIDEATGKAVGLAHVWSRKDNHSGESRVGSRTPRLEAGRVYSFRYAPVSASGLGSARDGAAAYSLSADRHAAR